MFGWVNLEGSATAAVVQATTPEELSQLLHGLGAGNGHKGIALALASMRPSWHFQSKLRGHFYDQAFKLTLQTPPRYVPDHHDGRCAPEATGWVKAKFLTPLVIVEHPQAGSSQVVRQRISQVGDLRELIDLRSRPKPRAWYFPFSGLIIGRNAGT